MATPPHSGTLVARLPRLARPLVLGPGRWLLNRYAAVGARGDERALRREAAVAAFFVAAALPLLWRLDGLLEAMHVPGAGSYGITDLAGLGAHWPDASHARDALQSWADADRAQPGGRFAPPRRIAGLYLALDTVVLVPAYVALFAAV